MTVNFFRKLAERMSRGVALRRKLKVGDRYINITVSPDAQLKYLKFGAGSFDIDLVNIALKYVRRNHVVWDIGANVGTFTFAAASLVGKGSVISVEADPWLASLLRKTASFKDYCETDISILSAAVSDKNSVSRFLIASRGRASNALVEAGGRSQMGGARDSYFVPTLTLDALLDCFPMPNFVKIDIEGAELLALRGASKLIEEVRPSFYIEVGGNVASPIYELFKEAGYSCVDPITGSKTTVCLENTLFVPK